MRIPSAEHEARPWRIREIAHDFELEDVWALPAQGRAEDFDALLAAFFALDPAASGSLPTRLLWKLRDLLGRLFDLGRVKPAADGEQAHSSGRLPIPGTEETSLAARLPEDLRDSAAGGAAGPALFSPLYRTSTEYAAEISNKTVHGVIHLAWVDRGAERYEGQMAVYVKPRGALGHGYMALISPFRHLIVYPALMRQIERAWESRARP